MSILSWLVTVWNIGGIILLVVFKIVYSLLLLFQLQFYSQKTGAVKHNRQDRKNRGKGRQTLLLRSHGLVTVWLVRMRQWMVHWLSGLVHSISGSELWVSCQLCTPLYLSVMLYAASKFTHIQEVLHQRLLDLPLKDKIKVTPLSTPSLSHPAPTIKSEFVICIAL